MLSKTPGYNVLHFFAKRSERALLKLRRLVRYSIKYVQYLQRLDRNAPRCNGNALKCLCARCHRFRVVVMMLLDDLLSEFTSRLRERFVWVSQMIEKFVGRLVLAAATV